MNRGPFAETPQTAERSHPRAREAFDLALGALRRNQHDEARSALQRALELAPDHAAAHATLGALLLDRGELDGARQALERAIELSPRDARARVLCCAALLRSGMIDRATKHAIEAAELAPAWPETRRQVTAAGVAMARAGRHAEAVTILQRATALGTADAPTYADLGMAQFAADRLTDAVASFNKAMETEPGCAQAHLGMGLVHARHERWEEALQELRVATRLAPSSEHMLYNLGLVYERSGSVEEARRALSRAAALAPEDEAISAALARVMGGPTADHPLTDSAGSIVGDLTSFPLTNLLEFLRLQTKSGTLLVSSSQRSGVIRLVDGRLASATSPRSRRLGEMLMERNLLTRQQFERALLEQTAIAGDVDSVASLGAIILEHRWIGEKLLADVVFEQTLTALDEMMKWTKGSFSFQLGDAAARATPPITFDVQHTILELLRRDDETAELGAPGARPGKVRNTR